MVELYTCSLDPETKSTLKVYLFKNVKNVDEIRNNIIKGAWKCAAVKPSLILDPIQIAVAANRAVVAERIGNMVTRTVYAEILYNLSLSKNISQSLTRFGIENEDALLICFLTDSGDESILKEINGQPCPITELPNFTNIKELKSVYKLNSLKSDMDILDVILSRMVTKNFVTY